uniref:Uncharacterized protein n=1 Tax=Globodera rostochiensis TaxID=31243 RepID=A0A914I752_GLORO
MSSLKTKGKTDPHCVSIDQFLLMQSDQKALKDLLASSRTKGGEFYDAPSFTQRQFFICRLSSAASESLVCSIIRRKLGIGILMRNLECQASRTGTERWHQETPPAFK